MKSACLLFSALTAVASLHADKLADPAAQAGIEAKIAEIGKWAAEPALVTMLVAHNAHPAAAHEAMTQDKWKTLSAIDPFVHGFTRNESALRLKARKAAWVTEAFVSDAKGRKVAFLAKPTNWSHAGKAKHDVPMTGATWQGKIEVDESTGTQQLQVAVPIRSEGGVVGSLVVGIRVLGL